MDAVVTETRVDWVTLTATHADNATAVLTKGLELVHEASRNTGGTREWAFQGYKGISTDHAAAGWRVDGACVRLGGTVAGHSWRDLLTVGGRISRLDLAVTTALDPGRRGIATDAYRAVAQGPKRSGRSPESSLILSSRGGETCYVGRRISERFLRLYRKDVESRGAYPAGSWRYEVEYKHDLARAVARPLAESPDAQYTILETVTAEFTRAGILVPWPLDNAVPGAISAHKDRLSIERQIEWVRSSVRPSLDRLSQFLSREELSDLVGLPLEHDRCAASSTPEGTRGVIISAR